jgi:hypothetical protein
MKSHLFLLAITGLNLTCLVSASAFAWGDDGHEIVGLIADHYLEPAVRAKVQTMLASDATGLTPDTGIAFEATWADKYRDSDRNTTKVRYNQTHNWHFIDLELDGADVRKACFEQPALPAGIVATQGAASDCVVDKITEFAAEVRTPGIDAVERRMALQFLLHFVGDVHQPLHASDDHDQGGNKKTVSGLGISPNNLHHDWDTEFVKRLGANDEAIAQQLIGTISDTQVAAWSSGAPVDWAQESYALARDKAYGLLPAPTSPGHYQLSASYVSEAKTVVASQLSKAGVRLAFILNTALRGDGAGSSPIEIDNALNFSYTDIGNSSWSTTSGNNPGIFDHDDHRALGCAGAVDDALWHGEPLPRFELYDAILDVNKKGSFEDEEEFVINLVFMPVIFALHDAQTHHGIVHFTKGLVVPTILASGHECRNIHQFRLGVVEIQMSGIGIDSGIGFFHISVLMSVLNAAIAFSSRR